MDTAVMQKEQRVKAVAIISALLLGGAAPGRDAGLDALAADDARVATVAWRLQTASVGLCKIVKRLPGFTVHSLGQYVPGDRARVTRAYRLGNLPAVLAVVPGSAAATAGLEPGDALVAINGRTLSMSLPQIADYVVTGAAEAAVEEAMAQGRATIEVQRGERRILIAFEGDRGCASTVQIVPGSSLGGQADGRYVQLTGATVTYAAMDDALAAIMAHELAHNFLQHRARLDAEGASRGVFKRFGTSGAKWRATEDEADRLSVWIIARGGYSLDAIVPFWTAWAKRRDQGPFGLGTHSGWKDRIARMAAAVAVAKQQKAAGQALTPAQ